MTAQIAPALLELPGCGALTAAKLLAEIGPIERFQTDAQLARHGGRPPPRPGRRPARRDLSPRAPPPARPRRHPPAQLRAAPDRGHPGARPSRRSRLPGTQAGRRQEPSRSDPLPQTPARTRRLQHTQSEPSLDIGATLAQASVLPSVVAVQTG